MVDGLPEMCYICSVELFKIKRMKDSCKTYIRSFSLQGLWGHKNVDWLNVNPDVNVLVGINGSGKTTLMNIMYAYYTNDTKELRKYKYQEIQGVPLNTETYPLVYLRTFDTPIADKRKPESPLMQELNTFIKLETCFIWNNYLPERNNCC